MSADTLTKRVYGSNTPAEDLDNELAAAAHAATSGAFAEAREHIETAVAYIARLEQREAFCTASPRHHRRRSDRSRLPAVAAP